MHDVGQQLVLGEQLAAAARLVLTGLAEPDVDPSGEQVLLVPFALAVAEQYKRGHAAILPGSLMIYLFDAPLGASPRSTVSTVKSICWRVTRS